MLRIEKTFEAAGIEEELNAYNPLIPDGHNWKATFMIEFGDPVERAQRLREMKGVEDAVWLQINELERTPICDEDLERENEEKTSSVHFLRFELTTEQISALKAGGELYAGIDHPAYTIEKFAVEAVIKNSLSNDLTRPPIDDGRGKPVSEVDKLIVDPWQPLITPTQCQRKCRDPCCVRHGWHAVKWQIEITPFTAETLTRMRDAGIAYTVATGRTPQAALGPLRGHGFELPHILKNGAVIWCPEREDYSHRHLLTQGEVCTSWAL